MPLFGKSHKSPGEIVRNLREALLLIEKGQDRKSEKAVEEVFFNISEFCVSLKTFSNFFICYLRSIVGCRQVNQLSTDKIIRSLIQSRFLNSYKKYIMLPSFLYLFDSLLNWILSLFKNKFF